MAAAYPGWPTSPKLEQLPDAWFETPDETTRKALCADILHPAQFLRAAYGDAAGSFGRSDRFPSILGCPLLGLGYRLQTKATADAGIWDAMTDKTS